MAELRAPDPTLTALGVQDDVLVDWTAPDNTYLPVAHLREHEGMHLCESTPADIARWFAVPCRKCFSDAPPPGRSVRDEFGRGPVGDPHLAWQMGGRR